MCPEDYPARPPYIMLTMNNGAFIINHKICLSITDYHPESWNPAWTVTHIIVGCISFWLTGEYTYGSLDSYDRDDMSYHKHNASYRSIKTVLEDPKFEEVLGFYKPFIGINEVKEVKNWIPLIEEDEKLPQHFILFKPKDIVSGDFYWVKEVNGMLYLAVADCTGHGVPGALMSMLGISLLNDILNDNHGISPGDLLTQLRGRIISELNQSEDEQASKDGMDISLIKLHLKNGQAEWAGANNPLWIVRKNDDNIEEMKPNKEPISYYAEMNEFANNSVQLNKGDSFYLFSDGYPDQFGGVKGKKLKYKAFKNLIVMNTNEEMETQKILLSTFFENWKGDFDQIDDICVFGVKV